MSHSRHDKFPVSVDFTSSSGSELDYLQTRREFSREKVNQWLQNDTKRDSEPFDVNPSHPFDDDEGNGRQKVKGVYELEIATMRRKVQHLLSFGEYSIFTKWKVIAEGDFIPFNEKSFTGCEHEESKRLSRKRRKISLRDIRTFAITSNWLILSKLYRTYRIEKDMIVPAGISLELHSLVPLRYINIYVSKPKARVIGIANQHGDLKEYQILDNAWDSEDPFMTWRRAIGRLRPKLSDDVLHLTLDTFKNWQSRHACRLTLHPNKNEAVSRLSQHSVNKSLSDRNRNRTNSPENSQSSSPGYQTGIEAIIGESVPLSPISDSPSEIEGVETIFGPDTEMAEVVESRRTTASTSAAYSAAETSDYAKVPAPSGASRRRKSLLGTFFRVGLFTAKAKRKSAAHDDSQSSDVSSPPPANRRLVQRRVSRLEMNDPIEDVFSGIVFATMDNQSPSCDDTRDRDSSDGDEIEEDPDVIMQSYINRKTDDEEAFVFKGIDDGGSHDNDDVIDPKENELLLPEAECVGSDSTDRPLTSETDLR